MKKNITIFLMGTGKGTTVLQLINAFENCSKSLIPFTFSGPKPNDIIQSIANVKKIKKILNWEVDYNLTEMCKTTITWLKIK